MSDKGYGPNYTGLIIFYAPAYYVVAEAERKPNLLIASVCFSSESALQILRKDFDRQYRHSSSTITQASRAVMTAIMMPVTNPTSTLL